GTVSEPEPQPSSGDDEATTSTGTAPTETQAEAEDAPQPIVSPTSGPPGTRVEVTQETGGCGTFSAELGGVGADQVRIEDDRSTATFTIPAGMGPGVRSITTEGCGRTGEAMFTVTESPDDTSNDGPPTTTGPPTTSDS